VQYDTEPQESQDRELVVNMVRNMATPPHNGVIGEHCTQFWERWNYPHAGGTQPEGWDWGESHGEGKDGQARIPKTA